MHQMIQKKVLRYRINYKAKASCMNGIESVKKNADSEIVEE